MSAAATQEASCSMWIELTHCSTYHAVQDAFFKNSNLLNVMFSWEIVTGSMGFDYVAYRFLNSGQDHGMQGSKSRYRLG